MVPIYYSVRSVLFQYGQGLFFAFGLKHQFPTKHSRFYAACHRFPSHPLLFTLHVSCALDIHPSPYFLAFQRSLSSQTCLWNISDARVHYWSSHLGHDLKRRHSTKVTQSTGQSDPGSRSTCDSYCTSGLEYSFFVYIKNSIGSNPAIFPTG